MHNSAADDFFAARVCPHLQAIRIVLCNRLHKSEQRAEYQFARGCPAARHLPENAQTMDTVVFLRSRSQTQLLACGTAGVGHDEFCCKALVAFTQRTWAKQFAARYDQGNDPFVGIAPQPSVLIQQPPRFFRKNRRFLVLGEHDRKSTIASSDRLFVSQKIPKNVHPGHSLFPHCSPLLDSKQFSRFRLPHKMPRRKSKCRLVVYRHTFFKGGIVWTNNSGKK
jgi:hypothetical protein